MTVFGACVGNDPNEVAAFETLTGLRVGFVSAHGDKEKTWDAMALDWVLWQLGMSNRPIVVTCPLIPKFGATLEEGAAGAYVEQHKARAREILAKFSGTEVTRIDDTIHVRLGEEFNGDWYHWYSKGREKTWAAAFQQAVLAFRAVSPRFRFWFVPNIGQNDPMLSYPGRAYVDGFGIDAYAMDEDGADPAKAWAHQCSKAFGFDWFFATAKAEGLPTAVWEWGVRADGWDAYVTAAVQRFVKEGVLFANIWTNDGDYPGDLRHYPKTAAAYAAAVKAALAPPAPAPAPATPVIIVATAPSDYLIVRVSGDSYQGPPQFVVTVDGKQAGGTLSTKADHAKGEVDDVLIAGSFSAGPHKVEVAFINDAWGGPGMDRNLYVHRVAFAGPSVTAPGGVAPLYGPETATFQTA